MPAVRYTASAEEDLLEIWLTIAESNLAAADNVLDIIHETAQLLAQHPLMGRERPELALRLRSFPTKTPYIVFYPPVEDGVIINRVLHHARDVEGPFF
jgi:toxin ParE1/3/4